MSYGTFKKDIYFNTIVEDFLSATSVNGLNIGFEPLPYCLADKLVITFLYASI
ncbi:hypothetical protein SAMN04487930_101125 [Cytophaga hutchinsonii ATCC 33406]|nr:hypothetical protein SAMN04487930_101125 [Cytophaga hutchinsonii ATCC 33406]